MKRGILARKVGMTQIFDQKGECIPVTVVKVGPCKIVGKRTPDKDGYAAVRIGFDKGNPYRMTKPELGLFKKDGIDPLKHIVELKVEASKLEGLNVGDDFPLDDFVEGDVIDVAGWSKGRGTQGVMRRHNFRGFRETHGTHEYRRHAGSIGNKEEPGRVWKGKRMEGRYGNEKITVQNLTLVKIDKENGNFLIRGSVPGPKNGLLMVSKAIKKIK